MILIASATSLGWRIDQSTSGSPTWRILLARGPTTERGLVGSTRTSIDDPSSIRPGNATEIKKERSRGSEGAGTVTSSGIPGCIGFTTLGSSE